MLFGKPIQQEVAKRTYGEFEKAGLTDHEVILQAGWDRLVEILDKGHYVRYDYSTATKLLEVFQQLKERYGTIHNLLSQSTNVQDLASRLQEFRGIGPKTASIFIDELLRHSWHFSDKYENHDPPQPHVVIVGAGFGGLAAARALAKQPVRITVIDRRNHHLFQPLLYQVATAGLAGTDITSPIRHILSDEPHTETLMAEVKGVDPQQQTVHFSDMLTSEEKTISYDYLIIATGSQENYFGHDEWKPLAPSLKSIEDAIEIRRRILLSFEAAELEPDPEKRRALLTFILIGGGPTGVELAGAIAELARRSLAHEFRHIHPEDARIILIEGESPDSRLFSQKFSSES